jgi:hypothetical protein
MFHKILFAGFILFLVGLGFVFANASKTGKLEEKYKSYGFVQSDVHYEKMEKSWGEQGLIFYQLKFPGLNVPHHVEKMVLNMNDKGLNARLSNVRLNVKQAMQNLYSSEPMQALDNYVPYRDFFNRILTSLSLLGVDEFVGDILVNTTYSDLKTMRFSIQVNQDKKETLVLDGVIHVPVVGLPQLSDLWRGRLESADIQIKDKSKLRQYIDYAKSRKFEVPQTLKNGIISLKKLSQKLPKLSDIMR